MEHEVVEKSKLSIEERQEIINELIMPVDTGIKLNSVILSESNKKSIAEFMKENRYKEKFIEYGLQPMNRLLFYGASGTGKTFLSKALSNELGYAMLYVDIAASLDKGKAASNVSKIFRLANDMLNCVIFLDECDGIAWNRDSSDAEGGDRRRALNSLFQNLDQLHYSNIFIAATNMLHRLDLAFERRFSMKMLFERPQMDLVESLKHFVKKGFRVIDDAESSAVDVVRRRAKDDIKLSYYMIEVIAERAMKEAIMNGDMCVYISDMLERICIELDIRMNINMKTGEIMV